MTTLSVREYGRIPIGSPRGSGSTVPVATAERITALKRIYGFEVFRYLNATTLAAQQYVGVLQTGDHVIEVLPKIAGDDDHVRMNLVGMLSVALDLEIGEGDIARVGKQTHSLLEILIRLYCDKLFDQLRLGLVRRYETQEDNLFVMRGRLHAPSQMRRNAANPERLFCHFQEFVEDHPLNIILKASLRVLSRRSRSHDNQRRLFELLFAFERVGDCAPSALPWHRVNFDRLSERYRPCYRLAELFLKGASQDVTAGIADGFSLFFDMNSLFEEYIGRIALPVLRKYGLHPRLQGPQRYLTRDAATLKHVFKMKPDLVAMKGKTTQIIVDTKWKRLSPEEVREGIVQADLYQMYAYAHRYGCENVLLLYPHDSHLGENPGVRRRFDMRAVSITDQSDERTCATLNVATVDLTHLKSVAGQLESIFVATEEQAERKSA